ncbi:hypothetical protein JY651_19435 [Pyxidicoccus parkwayensis]|uniref:DUF6265 domain-containing protein n=1 Tax=Pyxidicoccus parkwayensis TaxID=2813578 RepID=A0ABX7P935_9BACT|nr:DUF6265 family protein [Pyxidicoccus parkwaysis]QSQ26954.1 hypothetical protein JY651_19435 [Pyxidicoccus parkwaysis]
MAPAGEAHACGTSIDDVAWMTGSWQGPSGEGTVEEHWSHAAGGSMLGMGRYVLKERTAFFEYLRIEARPDGLYYIAHPKARAGVEFKLVRCSQREALFENPLHDHPKRILYRQESADRLAAHIEGEENGKPVSEDFLYTRR